MKRTVCNRLRFSRCEMRCNELCLNLGQNVWNPHTCSSSSHFVLFYRRRRETLRMFTTVCREVNAIAIIVSVYIVSLIEWCLWKANSLSSWMATMNCLCVCAREQMIEKQSPELDLPKCYSQYSHSSRVYTHFCSFIWTIFVWVVGGRFTLGVLDGWKIIGKYREIKTSLSLFTTKHFILYVQYSECGKGIYAQHLTSFFIFPSICGAHAVNSFHII